MKMCLKNRIVSDSSVYFIYLGLLLIVIIKCLKLTDALDIQHTFVENTNNGGTLETLKLIVMEAQTIVAKLSILLHVHSTMVYASVEER